MASGVGMQASDFVANIAAASFTAEADGPESLIQLALLAAIVESSDDGIVSETLEGIILSWNAGAQRLFGYHPEAVIGRPLAIIIPPELHEDQRKALRLLQRGERIAPFNTIRMTATGRRIPVSLTISPVRDPQGVIIGSSTRYTPLAL
jgi:PAS domain S-box-containing protein